MTGPQFPYEPDRDERYDFKMFDVELLRALGRLTLNASYLEGVVSTMLWRLIDNQDLDVGKRITADANFRWLIDHVRALSEYRLPNDLHESMIAWLDRAQRAYGRRSRIVHSGHVVSISSEQVFSLEWERSSARAKQFISEVVPASAEEVHVIAQELEAVGLEGVRLMTPVQDVVGHPD
jgi:hypothetical protein